MNTTRRILLATTILAVMPLVTSPARAAEPQSEIATLKGENAKLQKQLRSMMDRLDKIEATSTASAAKVEQVSKDVEKAEGTKENVVTVDDKGAFKLPGGTTFKVGGYVKADFLHDFSARPTSSGASTTSDSIDFTGIPVDGANTLGNRRNANRIDARKSRLNFATSTPTSYGPVKTFVEFDFYGSGSGNALLTNSYDPRLRQAYGDFYGFRVGQTWSTFEDTDVIPSTLDFNGPAGGITMRQALVRYTHDLGAGHQVAVAVENSESDYTNDLGVSNGNSINHAPDFVAAYRYDSSWGHVGLRGLARNIAFDSGSTTPSAAPQGEDNQWGYGLAASAKWLPFAGSADKAAYTKDNIAMLVQGGNGIGRYLLKSANLSAGVDSNDNLKLQNAFGGFAAVQHYWLNSLRSSVVYGHSKILLKDFMPDTTTKEINSVHANLIWSPIPSVDLGAEYIWGYREIKGGDSGEMNRAQISAKYSF